MKKFKNSMKKLEEFMWSLINMVANMKTSNFPLLIHQYIKIMISWMINFES